MSKLAEFECYVARRLRRRPASDAPTMCPRSTTIDDDASFEGAAAVDEAVPLSIIARMADSDALMMRRARHLLATAPQ